MILSFHPCFDTDRQVILKDRPLHSEYIEWIDEAEAIILPQSCSSDLYEQCLRSGAHLFPDYDMRFQYPGKVGQSMLFQQLGFPHPETHHWDSVEQFRRVQGKTQAAPHAFPFLIKEDWSHEGEGIFLIHGSESLSSALQNLAQKEVSGGRGFITQAFVPSGGNVLRAVIVGSRLITYWKRSSDPSQPIVSLGAGAQLDHHWQPELQEKARHAAASFAESTGVNLAAVDFLFSHREVDPQPLFLEVNFYFGRRGLGGSLAFYRLMHEALQEWLAEKKIDPKRVRLV